MNKLLLIVGSVIITSFGLTSEYNFDYQDLISDDSLKTLSPEKKHASEAYVITNLLKRYHYRKLPFNDSISSVIFDSYFDMLDPNRSLFYENDIKKFEKYRFQLDNQIPSGELQFAYDVFDIYRQRSLERINYNFSLLEEEFDFTKDEDYDYDRTDDPWPTTLEEKQEVWRKVTKNQALSYKLAGKEWNDISESLNKRYKRIEKAIYQYNNEDVFQYYMNSFVGSYDPHTTYFSPPDADNFQIDMSLSLEGIGARLMQNLDYTQVADIIAGGPAYKSKDLMKDDRIIGVGQGDEGEIIDVIGWRLDDVVSKIRGPKGSIVRLQILRESEGANALPDTIRLVRDKINLEQQAAKSEMIPLTEGNETYNLGVITLPSFYINWEELRDGKEDYRSSTRDVKKLISELEDQGMDGLMIDLRFNGGGSLQEAIEMTGLFIPNGPVVQVKNHDDSIDEMEDKDEDLFYDGPLAVLVNRGSASASEIFSGAIQDYKRGIVVGENTFGKGTVQNIIPLERYVRDEDRVGQIKMTLAKFYRVSGSSNQKIGIAPDIQFPSFYAGEEYGEASRENALPWDEIAGADFIPTNTISEKMINKLNKLYLSDLESDPDLQKLVSDIDKSRKSREEKSISLNIDERKSENEKEEDDNLEVTIDDSDIPEEEINEKLKNDPYLKEGLRLLAALKKYDVG